jgi:hypothetical protein
MQAGGDVVDAAKGGLYSGTMHRIPAAVFLYLVENCDVLKGYPVVQR